MLGWAVGFVTSRLFSIFVHREPSPSQHFTRESRQCWTAHGSRSLFSWSFKLPVPLSSAMERSKRVLIPLMLARSGLLRQVQVSPCAYTRFQFTAMHTYVLDGCNRGISDQSCPSLSQPLTSIQSSSEHNSNNDSMHLRSQQTPTRSRQTHSLGGNLTSCLHACAPTLTPASQL